VADGAGLAGDTAALDADVMSKRSSVWVSSSGWRTIMRPVSRPKNSSSVRPLTVMRRGPA
jgi:hypothetical protein